MMMVCGMSRGSNWTGPTPLCMPGWIMACWIARAWAKAALVIGPVEKGVEKVLAERLLLSVAWWLELAMLLTEFWAHGLAICGGLEIEVS